MSAKLAPMPATADLPFSWRRIALPAYGPSLVGSIGHGAIVPVVALTARELGASVSVAALFVSIVAVAEFVGSVPVGIFVDRVGERTALVIGGLLEVMAGLIGWFAPNLWVLALAAVVMGPPEPWLDEVCAEAGAHGADQVDFPVHWAHALLRVFGALVIGFLSLVVVAVISGA